MSLRPARAALAFLTRLPVGRLETRDFNAAPGWFAMAGLVIGLIQAGVWLAAAAVWPPLVAALLTVAVGLLITGALHEDGLADMVDGLGSGYPKDRALEIMRDSQIGSFGTLALIIAIGLRVSVLSGLGVLAPVALIAGGALSRAAMSVLLGAGPYLRAKGAGSGMTEALRGTGIAVLVVASGLAATLILYTASLSALVAGLAGLVIGAGLIRAWAGAKLGGITGDVLGAAQVVGEIGFILGMLACL